MDELIQLFNRNWFGSNVDLHYVNNVMVDFHFNENEIIQINMPTIEGQPKSSLLMSRGMFGQLVCLVLNSIRGYKPADIMVQPDIERASIIEIDAKEGIDFIENTINLPGKSDDSNTNSSDEVECTSDESFQRPLSPNSLDAALFALYYTSIKTRTKSFFLSFHIDFSNVSSITKIFLFLFFFLR